MPSIQVSSTPPILSSQSTARDFNARKHDIWGGGHVAWIQYSRLVSCLSAEIPSGMSVPQPAASDNSH